MSKKFEWPEDEGNGLGSRLVFALLQCCIPLLLLAALWLISSATHAEEGRWYNAQDTLRRAQVGTYSPRLAPPVKVETKGKPAQQHRFERLRCYVDQADRLRLAILCEPKDLRR